MTADEAVVAVLEALETVGVPYMIVGSLASNFHGIPRWTSEHGTAALLSEIRASIPQ